jgi:glycosyltransferase involved in cell wall biosynthesis
VIRQRRHEVGGSVTAPSLPLLPRVYWLTSEFFPPQMGGTGIITGRLADGLAERGCDVQVVTRQTEPPSPAWETIRKVRVRRLLPAGLMKGVGWRAIPAMTSFLARLARLLITARTRYDLVFISGMKTIPLIAVPLCRLLGRKCAIRIESPFEIAEPISAESLATMGSLFGRVVSQLFMRAQRLALRRADKVIAISEEIAMRLRGLGCPEADIVRIPNAIDLMTFAPVPPKERQLLRERLGFPKA